MYQEGQTATNPKTGQKIVFKGGQWVNAGGPSQMAQRRLTPQEEILLSEARQGASSASDMASQAQRFVELNKRAATGPIYAIPGVNALMSAFKPELAQMDALQARMAPAQRQPGSGTMSDRDLELFMRAIPSTSRMGTANQEIARDMQVMADKRKARSEFLDAYAKRAGTLKGAEAAFERYWEQRTKGGQRPPKSATGGGYKIISVE